MDIVIIGSGNVATVLGRKMRDCGHRILEVVARDAGRGQQLAGLLGATFQQDMGLINRSAQLYLVALSDTALDDLHIQLDLGRSLVVHTAGTVGAAVLSRVSLNYGVMYPLQSLSASQQEIPEFPLLVDGNSPETLTMIKDIASTITDMVIHADDTYRRKMHLAAVVTGNFIHHLLVLARDYCSKENIEFGLLMPYLRETIYRAAEPDLEKHQTGPAIRGDKGTLERHGEMLSDHHLLGAIYQLMTLSIQEYHRHKQNV